MFQESNQRLQPECKNRVVEVDINTLLDCVIATWLIDHNLDVLDMLVDIFPNNSISEEDFANFLSGQDYPEPKFEDLLIEQAEYLKKYLKEHGKLLVHEDVLS